MVTAEQSRRLHHLEVQEGFQHLVPSPSSPGLSHNGHAQCLSGRGAAGIWQAVQGEQAASQQRGGWLGRVAVEDVVSSQASEGILGSRSWVWSRRGGGWRRLRQDVRMV